MQVWVPIPLQSGTYRVELQASVPGLVLDTIETPTFSGQGGAGVVSVRLRVTRTGSGNGRVAAVDIDCGTKCTATYDYGTQLTLNAVADVGSRFVRWNGACGQASTCTIVVGPITTISAEFARR